MNMFLLIWAVVLMGVIYIYLRHTYLRFTLYDVKQLNPLPLFGNILPIILRKVHFVEELTLLYNSFPQERFVGKYEFTNPVTIIRDLELIKKIAIKDFDYFLDHRGFTDERIEPIFARNLFSLRGDEWKDMRSTLSPAFTSSKIRVMVPFMEEVGNQMMAVLKKRIKANGGQPIEVDCKDLTRHYANDVIATCAFGLKVDSYTEGDNEFFEMGRNVSQFKMRQLIMFLAYSAFPSIVRWLRMTLFSKHTTSFFKTLVVDTMRNREAHNIIRPDMIHLLMEAKKGKLNNDEKTKESDAGFATVEESAIGKKKINRTWSDNDLIAQAVLFFVAGFETVSIAMSFALRELALNKDIQDRLAEEIREDSQKNNGKIDYTSIQNLPYLDKVVSEVLRLWTPGFQLDRICTKTYNLGKPNKNTQKEYILNKGDQILIPVWCIHRDPEYFPDPEKFDPERFSDENKAMIKPMTYMPFGAGPRNCIGSRFALLEIKMLIYQILLHVETLPSEKTVLEPVLEKGSFNIGLEGGFSVNFRLRE